MSGNVGELPDMLIFGLELRKYLPSSSLIPLFMSVHEADQIIEVWLMGRENEETVIKIN